MKRFVDTHCHGIYGVDDGVQDAEGMLRFLQIAASHQTKLLFMTPHFINQGKYQASQELLHDRLKEIQSMITSEHLPLDVRLGSELYLDEAGLDLIYQRKHVPYQGTSYVLIEAVPPYNLELIDRAIEELKIQNQTAVIAHPERYFQDSHLCVSTVGQWIDRGACISVNRTSFWTTKKPWLIANAFALMNAGLIHLIASDAHHAPGRREPRLDDIYHYIARWTNRRVALELCIMNPQRLADNCPLQPVRTTQNYLGKKLGMMAQSRYIRLLNDRTDL